jgi:hypothetical protein
MKGIGGGVGERTARRQVQRSAGREDTDADDHRRRARSRHQGLAYNLDGSESKNLNPSGGGQPDEPIFSRASWEGEKLVILTRGTALVDGKPLETKRVIWLEKDGLLTIERSAEGAPTLRSVYQRSK